MDDLQQASFADLAPPGPRRGEYLVPDGAAPARCASCDAQIVWTHTASVIARKGRNGAGNRKAQPRSRPGRGRRERTPRYTLNHNRKGTPVTTPATATTKIIIVSGQEFSVPAETPEADIRSHLAQTFPDVASAEIKRGSKEVGGVTYQTIEFVKRAGTKGADGRDIAGVLAGIPGLRLSPPPTNARGLLDRVRRGQATIAEALGGNVITTIEGLPESTQQIAGGTLCTQIDTLPAVAGAELSAW